jgi:hypothetical protein
MIEIKPKNILKIKDRLGEKINFFMPNGIAISGITTLESVLLIKIMRIVKAKYLLEFGTFKGDTTRLLLENLPPLSSPLKKKGEIKRIFTIDLPNLKGVEFMGNDKKLAKISLGYKKKISTMF